MADGIHAVVSSISRPAPAAIRRAPSGSIIAVMVLTIAVMWLILADRRAAADTPDIRGWIVVELRGTAYSRNGDGPWQSLNAETLVAPGAVVRTGRDGHLVLANQADNIRLAPDSELELPAGEEADGVTRVIHWLGTAIFSVGKRPSPRFRVDTPDLVAIVKGTTFTTTVSEAGSSIKVAEGIVGVASAQGGASVDVAAGETASISAGDSAPVSPGELSGGSASDAGAETDAAGDTPDATDGGPTGPSSHSRDGRGQGGGNGHGGDRPPRGARGAGPDDDDDDNNDDNDDNDDDDHNGCRGDGGCHHDDDDRHDRRGRHDGRRAVLVGTSPMLS